MKKINLGNCIIMQINMNKEISNTNKKKWESHHQGNVFKSFCLERKQQKRRKDSVIKINPPSIGMRRIGKRINAKPKECYFG